MNTTATDLVIVGAGGQGLEAAWIAVEISAAIGANFNLLGFLDDAPGAAGKKVGRWTVLGGVDEFIAQRREQAVSFHCAIGRNDARKAVALKMEAAGFTPMTLISPQATVSPDVIIGEGSFVASRAYIGPEAKVGRHVLVNVHASMGHHSVAADFVHMSPGARVSGGCNLEEGVFLGSNAVLAPRVKMEAWSSLGATAFASRDIQAGSLHVSTPSRRVG